MYNIFFSIDINDAMIICTLINSIVSNTMQISLIKFNFLVDSIPTKTYIENDIYTKFGNTILYNIKVLNNDDALFINNNIRIIGPSYICNTMNFARFFIADYFFDIDFGLYLDSDIIVQSDITELFDCCLSKKRNICAVQLTEKNTIHFNAGMYFFDCNFWRNNNLTEKCKNIMVEHKNSENGLFTLGTQPILNLVFKNYGKLPRKWHLQHLGYNSKIKSDALQNAKLLHWNGPQKPWKEIGLYKELWIKYKK